MSDFCEFQNADEPGEVHHVNLEEVASVSSIHEDEDSKETSVITLKNGAEFHVAECNVTVMNEIQGIRVL